MSKAIWERDANGSETEWYFLPPKYRHDHPKLAIFLKNIARKKMTTPYLISAEFNCVREVFEPWIGLLIDEGSSMRFWGIYLSGFVVEEPFIRPTLCMRKGIWDGTLDFEQFSRAKDKASYVAQQQAVSLSILYTSRASISSLFELSREGIDIFRQGIKLERTEGIESRSQMLLCDIWDEETNYLLSYSPLSRKNDTLEDWIERWTHALDNIDFSKGYAPDGASRISYRESLADWMKYFEDLK